MTLKQGLTFYVLTEEVIRKRIARHNIKLECCLCGGTLRVGDSVVRKRRKMYHRICWENTYIDIPDSILDEEDLRLIEDGSIPTSISFSITSASIPFNTIPATITFAVANTCHVDLNQKHC
jgi:hypothetical protein